LPAVEAGCFDPVRPFDRFSALGKKRPRTKVILVDTMGDLADLYAGGDYIFCGGSLVDRGGHNIIEAARWGRAVYFGPHMKDFRDAARCSSRRVVAFKWPMPRNWSNMLLSI
jgi:3-deoxy-D-manno-octulosonic-acid transferase